VRRGEVWWYEGPDTKRRPVLILTRSEAVERLHDILVAPVTRTVRGIPTEVPLDEGDGMLKAWKVRALTARRLCK
jgi:mRNA interferase MazF